MWCLFQQLSDVAGAQPTLFFTLGKGAGPATAGFSFCVCQIQKVHSFIRWGQGNEKRSRFVLSGQTTVGNKEGVWVQSSPVACPQVQVVLIKMIVEDKMIRASVKQSLCLICVEWVAVSQRGIIWYWNNAKTGEWWRPCSDPSRESGWGSSRVWGTSQSCARPDLRVKGWDLFFFLFFWQSVSARRYRLWFLKLKISLCFVFKRQAGSLYASAVWIKTLFRGCDSDDEVMRTCLLQGGKSLRTEIRLTKKLTAARYGVISFLHSLKLCF